jgi:hypothetical protein
VEEPLTGSRRLENQPQMIAAASKNLLKLVLVFG